MKRELKKKVNARSLSRKKSSSMKSPTTSRNYHKTAGRRLQLRGTDGPSSTKIGAGSVTARRSLPKGMLHKRNHRTSEMMGYKL